jgi:hypothetical protein
MYNINWMSLYFIYHNNISQAAKFMEMYPAHEGQHVNVQILSVVAVLFIYMCIQLMMITKVETCSILLR